MTIVKRLILLGMGIVFLSGCASARKREAGRSDLPSLHGPKKTIAVNDFDNKSGYLGQANLGTGMADQLADALVRSGHFIVLERQIMEDILEEQDLAASGRTSDSKTAHIGKVTSTQMLVQGVVTECELEQSRRGQAIAYAGVSISADRSSAHVAVIIRLVDTTTGQVIDSQRVEGKAEAGGLALGVSSHGVGFDTSGHRATPLGKATQIAIDRAVGYIVKRLARYPWQGKIITVKDDSLVYINAGSQAGVAVGDTFEVFRTGESLTDPDTGVNLGAEETLIGRIDISEVNDKFSKGTPVTGVGFQKGDVVRYQSL